MMIDFSYSYMGLLFGKKVRTSWYPRDEIGIVRISITERILFCFLKSAQFHTLFFLHRAIDTGQMGKHFKGRAIFSRATHHETHAFIKNIQTSLYCCNPTRLAFHIPLENPTHFCQMFETMKNLGAVQKLLWHLKAGHLLKYGIIRKILFFLMNSTSYNNTAVSCFLPMCPHSSSYGKDKNKEPDE